MTVVALTVTVLRCVSESVLENLFSLYLTVSFLIILLTTKNQNHLPYCSDRELNGLPCWCLVYKQFKIMTYMYTVQILPLLKCMKAFKFGGGGRGGGLFEIFHFLC